MEKTKLNLGCGRVRMTGDEWVNADIQYHELNDVFNFNKFPYPYTGEIFEYVLIDNTLEHLDDPHRVLEELWRICKPGAIIEIIVPHYHCRGAYNDITHKHYFNEVAIRQMIEGYTYCYEHVDLFEIIYLKSVPTLFGKLLLFDFIREKANLFLGEVYSSINFKIKVLKVD